LRTPDLRRIPPPDENGGFRRSRTIVRTTGAIFISCAVSITTNIAINYTGFTQSGAFITAIGAAAARPTNPPTPVRTTFFLGTIRLTKIFTLTSLQITGLIIGCTIILADPTTAILATTFIATIGDTTRSALSCNAFFTHGTIADYQTTTLSIDAGFVGVLDRTIQTSGSTTMIIHDAGLALVLCFITIFACTTTITTWIFNTFLIGTAHQRTGTICILNTESVSVVFATS
jgi:hypothetical protein